MKRFLLLPLVLAGILLAHAATPPSGQVILAFDYPVSDLDTNLVFRIYGSTNIAMPFTNWTVLASALGSSAISTNAGLATFNLNVTIQPGRYFFYCTASNFWAESDPSTVAFTPALPRSDSKLSIKRGP